MAILLCNFWVNSARFKLGSLDFSNLKNIPIAWNWRNLSMTWHFWKNRNLHFQNWLQQVRDHVLYLLDFLEPMLVRDTLLLYNRSQSNFRKLRHCQSANSRNIFVNVIFSTSVFQTNLNRWYFSKWITLQKPSWFVHDINIDIVIPIKDVKLSKIHITAVNFNFSKLTQSSWRPKVKLFFEHKGSISCWTKLALSYQLLGMDPLVQDVETILEL